MPQGHERRAACGHLRRHEEGGEGGGGSVNAEELILTLIPILTLVLALVLKRILSVQASTNAEELSASMDTAPTASELLILSVQLLILSVQLLILSV